MKTMGWLGLVAGLAVRSMRSPSLVPALFSTAWRFRSRRWYAKPPFLPLPDRSYLRWRLYTAYGNPRAIPPAEDVERYARWSVGALLLALAAVPTAAPAQASSQAAGCCATLQVSGSEGAVLTPARRTFWVWIEPSSPFFGWSRSYPAAAREAFEEWSRAALPVDFAFVDDSTNANLLVFWRRQFDHGVRGRSTWWTDERLGYVRGEIEIAVAWDERYFMHHGLVRGIAIHEIGHLLGLAHSNDARSVMSRTVSVTNLPERDISWAKALYATALRSP
jgi:hypothetical protein